MRREGKPRAEGLDRFVDGETRLIVTRKGLKAALEVEDTQVRVALDLGFLLGPLGGSIRAGIVRQLTGILS